MLGGLQRVPGLPCIHLQEGEDVVRLAALRVELDCSLAKVLPVSVFPCEQGEVEHHLIAIDPVEVFHPQSFQPVAHGLLLVSEEVVFVMQVKGQVLRLLVAPAQDIDVALLRSAFFA